MKTSPPVEFALPKTSLPISGVGGDSLPRHHYGSSRTPDPNHFVLVDCEPPVCARLVYRLAFGVNDEQGVVEVSAVWHAVRGHGPPLR
jgi:hypothetical protein